jgi:hypothetical protein
MKIVLLVEKQGCRFAGKLLTKYVYRIYAWPTGIPAKYSTINSI